MTLDLVDELSKAAFYLIAELEKEAEKESDTKIKDQINLKIQMLKRAESKLMESTIVPKKTASILQDF